MDRRQFVAGLVTAAGTASAAGELAINGGTPVRATPMESDNWGTSFYDDKEKAEMIAVVDARHPFRFDRPSMEVATFEKEFAQHMQAKYALAVTSGTAALEVAVNALGIGPGDEVIIPAYCWHSDAMAVVRAGALPVFAEIDESFNIDPNDIEQRITPNTKCIIAASLIGCPADLDKIMAIAKKHNLKVLEDAAESVGSSYKGKPLGSIGDIGIYSHQESKTITSGDGGSLVTSDPLLFERACRFHDVGSVRGPHSALLGRTQGTSFVSSNFRMNEFTGGIMLAQIRKLNTIISTARANAAKVYAGVRDLPGIRFRLLPDPEGDCCRQVYVRFADRERCDKFIQAMRAEGVAVSRPNTCVVLPGQSYIVNKVTTHPAWPTWNTPRGKAIEYGMANYPRTVDILQRFAGPPMHPKHTDQDVADIIAAIRKVYPKVAWIHHASRLVMVTRK